MNESPSSAIDLVEEFAREHPEALALAETLSLAVRVEPALLREARLTLHPGVSVGAEADLWFSPLVESSSARGFVFAAEVQRELRDRLKKAPERLHAAWELLQRFHPFTSTVVALEEHVTWLSLARGDDATSQIDQLLGEAVQAMRSNPERALGIARWAMGALRRLPPEVQRTEAATALNVGTLFYVGGPAVENLKLLPSKLSPSALGGLPKEMDRSTVYLRWDVGSLHVVGRDEAQGAHALRIPEKAPALLSLEWIEVEKAQQRFLLAEPGARETLPESVSRLRITALDGQVWELVAQSPSAGEHASRRFVLDAEGAWDAGGSWDGSAWSLDTQRQWHTWLAIRRAQGESHPGSLAALGELLYKLQEEGRIGTARAILEQTIESLRKAHGPEHPAVLTLQNQLAEVLRAAGDLVGARHLQERVLEATARLSGNEHSNTLVAMNNLAMTLKDMGDWQPASSLLERALELQDQNPRTDTLQALTTLNNLSLLRHAEGRNEEAREMQARVLEGRRHHLGDEHPSTLQSMNNLGLILLDEGRLEEARALYEQALDVLQRTSGEENLLTLTVMANLGAVLKARGDLAGARALLERVLASQRRILGELGLDALRTQGNLAVVIGAQGHKEQAQALEEEVVQRSIELLGREHPNTITTMTNLAETRRSLGRLALAREGQQQALELARRVFGPRHPETLTIMNNLAGVFMELAEWNTARQLLQEVLEMRVDVLGEAHLQTMETLRRLAWTLEQMGAPVSARVYYERVLRIQAHLLGENHTATLATQARLVELQRKQTQAQQHGVAEEEDEEDDEELEDPSGLPDIPDVQDALFDDFVNDLPSELEVLANSTEIDGVDVQALEEDPDHPGGEHFRGSGDVSIIRHYGKGDDADSFSDSYPFTFTLQRNFDGSLEVLDKSVDTRSFYGEEDPDDAAPSEETDTSEASSRDTPNEDSPFIGDAEAAEALLPVFVSFVHRDDAAHLKTLEQWADEGLLGEEVFVLAPSYPLDGPLSEGLGDVLDKARAVLVLVGDNTHSSRWTLYEVRAALSARKPIIVVRVPGTTGAPPAELRDHPEVAFEPQAIAWALRELASPF